MKISKLIYLVLIISLIISSLFVILRKKKEEIPVRQIDTKVVFLSGDVFVIYGAEDGSASSEEIPVVIGDKLKTGDILKTGEDSYLEILIDNNAVIRMEDNTELTLTNLFLIGAVTDISVALTKGSIINKVEKLVGDSTYAVKTKSAAFGVRGTSFLIQADSAGDLLAVKEGSVQLLPHPELVEALKKKYDKKRNNEDFIELLEESFPLLEVGQQVVFTKASSDAVLAAFSLAEEAVVAKENNEISNIDFKEKIAAISETIVVEKEKIADTIAPVTPENNALLASYNTMEILGIEENVKEIIFKTEPEGAQIFFDNIFAGYNSVTALYPEDKVLKVTVTKEGFFPFEKEMRVGDITEKPYLIFLVPEGPGKGVVEISVSPADSEIFIVEEGQGYSYTPDNGRFTGSFDEETSIRVTVRKKEYAEQAFSVSIEEGKVHRRNISLEPLVVPYLFTTGLSGGKAIETAGRGFVSILDNDRNLAVVSSSNGKVVYKSTSPIEGTPLFTRDRVLFVSDNALKSVESASGSWKEVGSLPLEDSLYRMPYLSGDKVYINSGASVLEALLPVDAGNFNLLRAAKVPDIIVSNPLVYDNKILSVTDKGVLQIIGESETPLSSVPVSMGNPLSMTGVISNGKGFFASAVGTLAIVDLEKGALSWSTVYQSTADNLKASVDTIPTIIDTGEAIAVFSGVELPMEGNNLAGRNLVFFNKDGKKEKEIERVIAVSLGRDVFYAAVGDGTILLCSPEDGTIMRRGKTELSITGMIFEKEMIHAVLENGNYAIINPAAFK